MREEARGAQSRLNKRGSPSTRLDTTSNDYIGDLAHQAVEICLKNAGYQYQSTRLESYTQGGDQFDVRVLDKKFDIKGTRLPDDYFYVYSKNAHNPSKEITDYLFVQITRDDQTAYIYGFINKADLISQAKEFPAGTGFNFNHDNLGIPLYKLDSLMHWLDVDPLFLFADAVIVE